ncbi:MAG: sulfotransferase [Solirubrobacterales bacterium]
MAKAFGIPIGRRRAPSRLPAPFIVGVGRSGTTLLRLMLDAHPEMAIPSETYFVPPLIRIARDQKPASVDVLLDTIVNNDHHRWGDHGLDEGELRARLESLKTPAPGAAVRAFYELYAERHNARRWGDKTPLYLKEMQRIHSALPEASFIHMIRDGRDVALSFSNRLRSMDPPREPPPPAKLAKRWKRLILRGRRTAEDLPSYREVRYEELVAEPERTLMELCAALELDFDPAMTRYHERAGERLDEMARDLPEADGRPLRPGAERMRAHAMAKQPPQTQNAGKWRDEMPEEDVAAYESVAGDLLAELGYETGVRA